MSSALEDLAAEVGSLRGEIQDLRVITFEMAGAVGETVGKFRRRVTP